MKEKALDLIKIAKSASRGDYSLVRSKFPKEEVQKLAIAWVKGEVTTSQACIALGRDPNTALTGTISTLSMGLRSAYQDGILKAKD